METTPLPILAIMWAAAFATAGLGCLLFASAWAEWAKAVAYRDALAVDDEEEDDSDGE